MPSTNVYRAHRVGSRIGAGSRARRLALDLFRRLASSLGAFGLFLGLAGSAWAGPPATQLPADGVAAVAVDGDVAVIGTKWENNNVGSAAVWVRCGGAWVLDATIPAPATNESSFGNSVAVSGDTLVVGALTYDSYRGAAFVFTRDASGTWKQVAKLTASDGEDVDLFGNAVAISRDTIVIGSIDDDHGRDSGAVYVFTRDAAGTWTQSAKLTASDAAQDDYFGYSVSISGDTALFGAIYDDDGGDNSGAAYVFTRGASGAWTQSAKLTAPNAAAVEYFGGAVAISGETALISSSGDAVGGSESGAAHVFTRGAGGTWTHTAKLKASDAASGDRFGSSVAVAGDVAAIGSDSDDGFTGSAYTFARDSSGTWSQQHKLTAPDAAVDDRFGNSVAVSGDTALVGGILRLSVIAYSLETKLTASDASANATFSESVAVSGDTTVVGAPGANGERGAAYVSTRDASGAWSERVKLTASDAAAGDRFGNRVAIDRDTAVIAAPQVGGGDTGAAYVFTRDASGAWTEQAKLRASDPAVQDYFGYSVAVAGDTVIVGSALHSTSVQRSGAAYVFTRDASGTWTEQAKLVAADAGVGDAFGYSAAVSGDTVVIGSYQDDDTADFSGSAYVFKRAAGVWSRRTIFRASHAEEQDRFGTSVSVSGETVVVGARGEDDVGSDSGAAYVFSVPFLGTESTLTASPSSGADNFGAEVAISGDTALVGAWTDDVGQGPNGSVFVFRRGTSGTWTHTAKLTASDPAQRDHFGEHIAVSGDSAIVGAYRHPNNGLFEGAAYVFHRGASGAWTREAKLTASDAAEGDQFGWSVAISGDTAIVGAFRDENSVGAAYVFRRDAAGTWTQTAKLTASDGGAFDVFGYSVAISGDTIVVGAYFNANAAYVFRRDAAGDWTETAKLQAAGTSFFGESVSVSGNTAVVGARYREGDLSSSGSAHVFTRDATGTWSGPQSLTASDAAKDVFFGRTLSISGDTLFVGSLSNSAYIFRRDASGGWEQTAKLTDGGPSGGASLFGIHVAVSGDTAITTRESNTGETGLAYVYPLPGPGAPLEVVSSTLPPSTTGASYFAEIRAAGGARPRRFDVAIGTLPAGLVLDERTGVISGTCGPSGTDSFTVRVSDPCGQTTTQSLSIEVRAAPQITTSSLAAAALHRPFATEIAGTGGVSAFTWSIVEGALPVGINLIAPTATAQTVDLSAAPLVLSGRPTSIGTSSFRLRCTDAFGISAERSFTLDVAPVADLRKKLKYALATADGTTQIIHALELVAGTRLDVTVKFKRTSTPPVRLEVLSGDGAPAPGVRVSKSGTQLKGLEIPVTGRYFVRVTPLAPFAGKVVLSVKVTPPTKAKGSATIAEGTTREIRLGTLAGARVSLTVKRAKGSSASPTIVSVKDDTGTELLKPIDVRTLAKSAVAKLKLSGAVRGGTLTVTIGTLPGAGGAVTWSAKIKQPKSYDFTAPELPAGSSD